MDGSAKLPVFEQAARPRKRSLRPDDQQDDTLMKTLKTSASDIAGGRTFSTESTLVISGKPTDDDVDKSATIQDWFTLGGLKVRNVRLAFVDALGHETPVANALCASGIREDFVPPNDTLRCAYVGDTKLLWVLPAKVYIFDSDKTASAVGNYLSSFLHPYSEVVRIASLEVLSLGTFVPSLAGSEWDAIRLVDPKLGYVESSTTGMDGMPLACKGLYFETKLVFDGALKPVSDFLEDFFEQKDPGIDFSARLGRYRDYCSLQSIDKLVLTGVLRKINCEFFDLLTFREIGVELAASQSYDMRKGRQVWNFDWALFGKLNVTLPGLDTQLDVNYRLRKYLDIWQLALQIRSDEWKDAFGVKRLNLCEVQFVCELDRIEPKKTEVSFDIMASMTLRNAKMQIRGRLSKDYWELSVYVGDLTFADLGEILYELTGYHIDAFDYDVTFKSMMLRVSSKGIALAGSVSINGHTSAQGSLILEEDGVGVSGAIQDITFDDWGLTVEQAGFQVFIASKKQGPAARKTTFAIHGQVNWREIEAKVALYTNKKADGNWAWTIYGEVSGDISTSRFMPALKGNEMLDIALERLAIIASNDIAIAGSMPEIPYEVINGVQLCASIGRISALDSLLGGSVDGMTLRVACSMSGDFDLGIILPAARTIRFTETIWTGPIALSFGVKKGVPALCIAAILNFQIEGQVDNKPLQLRLALAADVLGADVTAELLTDWTNPCGVGKDVVIHTCALTLGLKWSSFLASGPSTFGFDGDLQIGSRNYGFTMLVSQNPKEQVLRVANTGLTATDLADFASLIAQRKLPPVEEDLLVVHDFKLYLSTGATIGKKEYPAGAQLKGDMTIFGKRAKFNCEFGTLIKISATIQQFSIGPLRVRAASDVNGDPVVDIEFSASTQKILIDGAVDIWDATAALHVDIQILPETKFHFHLFLKLSDLFLLKLNADLKGKVNIKDYQTWAQADFFVKGLMEQKVIDCVTAQLEAQLAAVHESAKVGFKTKELEFQAEEAVFKRSCDAASARVEETQERWQVKEAEVQARLVEVRVEVVTMREQLERAVNVAEAALNGLINEKKTALEQAESDQAAKMQFANIVVNAAQVQRDDAVRDKQTIVNQRRQELNTMVTNAASNIVQKESLVDKATAKLEDVKSTLRQAEHERAGMSDWNPMKLTLDIGIRGTRELVNMAQSSLDHYADELTAASNYTLATDYITCEARVLQAETDLTTTRNEKTIILESARTVLMTTDEVHKQLVSQAIRALDEAKTESAELNVAEKARTALHNGEQEFSQRLSAAQKAVRQLSQSIEYVAFSLAQNALTLAKENTKELNLKRAALEVARDAVDLGLDLADWANNHAQQTFNIHKVEFSGNVQSLVHPEGGGPPLRVKVLGTVLGENIDWEIIWKPKCDLVMFVKEFFEKLWEKIKAMAKDLGKALKKL